MILLQAGAVLSEPWTLIATYHAYASRVPIVRRSYILHPTSYIPSYDDRARGNGRCSAQSPSSTVCLSLLIAGSSPLTRHLPWAWQGCVLVPGAGYDFAHAAEFLERLAQRLDAATLMQLSAALERMSPPTDVSTLSSRLASVHQRGSNGRGVPHAATPAG